MKKKKKLKNLTSFHSVSLFLDKSSSRTPSHFLSTSSSSPAFSISHSERISTEGSRCRPERLRVSATQATSVTCAFGHSSPYFKSTASGKLGIVLHGQIHLILNIWNIMCHQNHLLPPIKKTNSRQK